MPAAAEFGEWWVEGIPPPVPLCLALPLARDVGPPAAVTPWGAAGAQRSSEAPWQHGLSPGREAVDLGKEGGCKGAGSSFVHGWQDQPPTLLVVCVPEQGWGWGLVSNALGERRVRPEDYKALRASKPIAHLWGLLVVLAWCVAARCRSGVTVLLLLVPIRNVGGSLQRRQCAALRNETSARF